MRRTSFWMNVQSNLLMLKEDQTNTSLEIDGEDNFQFYYRNVIVQSF